MHSTTTVATRFAHSARVLRTETPLTEDQMRAAAPSVFAEAKHASRSERYTCIPTIDVLRGLRKQGFEPFMVAQGKSRIEGKAEFTKHLVRLRHARERHAANVTMRAEANEIVLINSHDGASSYRMLAGVIRYVCSNGLVVGDIAHDVRIAHKGDVASDVIDGAFRVVEDFDAVDASIDAMKSRILQDDEERTFATAALALRYGERIEGQPAAPVTAEQLMQLRRPEDVGHTVWANLQRTQEHLLRGGQTGRSAQGLRIQTGAIGGIDRNVSLNRALWGLAEEMRKPKA
jgi:hypothetical protein